MSRKSITYNGTSLQTSNIITERILFESYDNRVLHIEQLSTREGGKLVDSSLRPKKITLTGHLQYTTQTDYETALDTLKGVFNTRQKNLDIEHAGETRRFLVTPENVELERQHYNINWSPFSVSFIVPDGYGTSTTEQTISYSTSTIGTVEVNGSTIIGTLNPAPLISITINSETNLTEIKFKNETTDRQIVVSRSFDTDVLTIDLNTLEVAVNGIITDYTGTFPDFVLGSNDWKVVTSASSVNYEVAISYYPRYI